MFRLFCNRLFLMPVLALLLSFPAITPLTLVGAHAHDTNLRMGSDPRDRIFGRGAIPHCDDPRVLRRIQKKFKWADRKTWSDITHRSHTIGIRDIYHIRQKYRLDHTKPMITHRHCSGKAGQICSAVRSLGPNHQGRDKTRQYSDGRIAQMSQDPFRHFPVPNESQKRKSDQECANA